MFPSKFCPFHRPSPSNPCFFGFPSFPVLLFCFLLLWIFSVFLSVSAYFTAIVRARRVGKVLDIFEVFPWFFKKTPERKDRVFSFCDDSLAIGAGGGGGGSSGF